MLFLVRIGLIVQPPDLLCRGGLLCKPQPNVRSLKRMMTFGPHVKP